LSISKYGKQGVLNQKSETFISKNTKFSPVLSVNTDNCPVFSLLSMKKCEKTMFFVYSPSKSPSIFRDITKYGFGKKSVLPFNTNNDNNPKR